MLCAVERQKLLTCVQCLAGCVEFSGVGDEKRYLEMCTEALTRLREVQAYFNRVCRTHEFCTHSSLIACKTLHTDLRNRIDILHVL